MMREEFEQRTGFLPSMSLYEVIEKYYTSFGGDQALFCKAYTENADGLASQIQHEADMQRVYSQKENEKVIGNFKSQIAELEKVLESMKKALEREQEWKPYEIKQNVAQADYEKLAHGADAGRCCHYMTDREAIEWICEEFDFNPSKITIIHEIDEYEINRHNQLRRTGRKIDRRPVYCASDYHYIRFNTSHWYYEVWNGQLRPFYD